MTIPIPVTLKPTETVTWYNLILLGLIGGIGVMILSEKIKDKTQVPIREIALWGVAAPAVAAIASVYIISKSAQ